MKKIYLAIPYSILPEKESSYIQATEIAKMLMDPAENNIPKGFVKEGEKVNVYSPITHSHPLSELGLRGDWDFWKDIDFQYIDWCDEVWVIIPIEGKEYVNKSTGVNAEIEYANETSKPVRFIRADKILNFDQ